jgi:Hemolysin activation/secretion protein
MRKITSTTFWAFAILMAMPLAAQESTRSISDKEIIKTGWNIGILPVIGYDSDLGFQYGICSDIFNYGDGTRYPSYDYKVNLEASTYTKGSSVLRCYGDFKTLIPDGKLFFDVTYFNAPKFEFYGFNGFSSLYVPETAFTKINNPVSSRMYDELPVPEGRKSAFNWISRNQFRAVVSMQKKISGGLNWAAGLAYYNIRTGDINRDKLAGDDAEKKEWYANQLTLYNFYNQFGMIAPEEAEGGNVTQLKAGLTYDTRDHDSDPTRGVNIEATFYYAPDILDRTDTYNHTNGGILFMGSHYVPVVGDKLTLAYRLGAQYTLFGNVPFYFCNNMNTMFFRKMYTEGLGGNASVRGIHRNGVIGDGFALLNAELRWRIVEFRFINQNWGFAVNPFFDCGQVIKPHKLDVQKQSLSPVFYSGEAEHLHCTAGCGLKLVMNHNMVVSFEAAKAFSANDGTGLWTNIGFNYLF